jgi:hypothetical protein
MDYSVLQSVSNHRHEKIYCFGVGMQTSAECVPFFFLASINIIELRTFETYSGLALSSFLLQQQ